MFINKVYAQTWLTVQSSCLTLIDWFSLNLHRHSLSLHEVGYKDKTMILKAIAKNDIFWEWNTVSLICVTLICADASFGNNLTLGSHVPARWRFLDLCHISVPSIWYQQSCAGLARILECLCHNLVSNNAERYIKH